MGLLDAHDFDSRDRRPIGAALAVERRFQMIGTDDQAVAIWQINGRSRLYFGWEFSWSADGQINDGRGGAEIGEPSFDAFADLISEVLFQNLLAFADVA